MLKLKRFLNLKTIALAATLVFIVVSYFAARKVMVWDVELGMDKEAVHKVQGSPTTALPRLPHDYAETLFWQKEVIDKSIFQQLTVVLFDEHGKVAGIRNRVRIFGYIIGSDEGSKEINLMLLVNQMKQQTRNHLAN